MDNKEKFSSYIFCFYFVPVLMSFSLAVIIEGKFSHISYGVNIEGIQAIMIGISLFLIPLHIIYFLFYKYPSENGGKNKIKIILSQLLHSSFFYIMLITIISPHLLKLLDIVNAKEIYILLLIICGFSQHGFIEKMKVIYLS